MALDIEADRLEYWEPGFTVFLIQWDDGEGDQGCWREGEPFDALHAALGRHEALCGANFGYDQHGLKAAGIVDLFEGPWRCYDVQTLARVVVPGRFEYTLEGLGRDLLGADAVQEQGALKAAAQAHKLRWTKKDKDYYGLWKLEPELMVRYGMEDVALTIALWNLLWARATPADCEVFMMEATQVAPLLRAAEHEGVLVDQERLAALKRHLLATRDELRCQLLAQGLSEEALGTAATEDEAAGKRSDAALLADLLRIGIPLYRKTPKSGEISEKTGKRTPDKLTVNKDALKEFELRFPVVKDLIAWRSCNQILSTFVAALEKADPRVHTSFRQAEARTSRMSSAVPNLMNLPRPDEDAADADNEMALGIRRVIVPAPGNALLVADYSGIEVMVMAHYIADVGLTEALEAGKDLYALNASLVYGLPYDDCTKAGTTQGKAYRQRSKTTVLTCVPEAGTEILTQRGWLRHDEVRAGDRTLGHNDGLLEWTEVTAVHHPGEAEVVTYGTSRFQMRCTRDHRWLADGACRPVKGRPRQYAPPRMLAYDQLSVEDRIVTTLPYAGGTSSVTPDEAAIVAWVLTDGTLRVASPTGRTAQASGRHRAFCATIIQKREPQRAAIRELLERTGALAGESVRPGACSEFRLRSPWTRELWRRAGLEPVRQPSLTAFVLGLSRDALAAFVQAGLDAEGWRTSSASGWSWSQNVGPVLDGFRLAFSLAGHRPTYNVSRKAGASCGGFSANADHVVVALAKPHVTMQGKRRRELSVAREPVWCVTTRSGTWFMRQGNELMVTGNCMYGGGAQLLSTRLGCSTMEAAEIKRWTLDAIPGYWAFDTRVKNRARSRAQCHVVTILGRRLSVPRGKLYVALNTIVQGTSAELMKLGLIAGAAALKPHGYRPLLVVHDECVAEGPAGNADDALLALVPAMQNVYPLRPGLKVEADYSEVSYADCK